MPTELAEHGGDEDQVIIVCSLSTTLYRTMKKVLFYRIPARMRSPRKPAPAYK